MMKIFDTISRMQKDSLTKVVYHLVGSGNFRKISKQNFHLWRRVGVIWLVKKKIPLPTNV
jgi:hypothetical protein